MDPIYGAFCNFMRLQVPLYFYCMKNSTLENLQKKHWSNKIPDHLVISSKHSCLPEAALIKPDSSPVSESY